MRTVDMIEADGESIVVSVHVQPGAGRSALVGRHGAAIKIRVAAPPVDGRANDEVVKILAEAFGASEQSVVLVAGPRSRAKRFRIAGVDLETARERLELAMDAAAARGPGEGRRHR